MQLTLQKRYDRLVDKYELQRESLSVPMVVPRDDIVVTLSLIPDASSFFAMENCGKLERIVRQHQLTSQEADYDNFKILHVYST